VAKALDALITAKTQGKFGTALLAFKQTYQTNPQELKYYHLALVGDNRLKVIEIFDSLAVLGSGCYPVYILQPDSAGNYQPVMGLGDRDGLEAKFLSHVKSPIAGLVRFLHEHAASEKNENADSRLAEITPLA
jgi:hypothetical protein